MASLVSALLTTLLAASAGGSAPEGDASPWPPELEAEQAAQLAGLALACVDRPWPYKTGHVLTGEESLREPKSFHPVFYGCFDWHSAVHGHWMLVRLLRVVPDHPRAEESRAVLNERFTEDAFRREAAYFARPETRSFERPYGWAWLLRLAQEMRAWDDPDAERWARAIRPLEEAIVERMRGYLPRLTWPIRTGVHPNTAFALGLALDYARSVGDEELAALVATRALGYYEDDRDAPVEYEPSGEDFFSPSLLEADLMRRVLAEREFSRWLTGFLPGLSGGRLGGLDEPATVSDRSDPKIVHLDGLNLVRAWTMDGIAAGLPEGDPRARVLRGLARRHATAGLRRIASGHYEGEHWLASFAVYLTTRAGLDGARKAAPEPRAGNDGDSQSPQEKGSGR